MKNRCPWLNLKNTKYIEYHDNEWGRPIKDDQTLFEMLTLEGAQAGLSWETVLNKRENYKKLFSNFDISKVSRFSPKKVEKLLLDPGIIRNRLKVESTISNAKVILEIQKEFGSFSSYLWGFSNNKTIYNHFNRLNDYPSRTDLSDMISKDMKKRGLRFVGSTIIYAYMQAIGMVQDHSSTCYLHNKKFRIREPL